MNKTYLLVLGIVWSGGLITANSLKMVDLGSNRDFFIGVFGACSAGLGLTKPKEKIEESPKPEEAPLTKNGEFY